MTTRNELAAAEPDDGPFCSDRLLVELHEVELHEVAVTHVGAPPGHLVIETWRSDRALPRLERR